MEREQNPTKFPVAEAPPGIVTSKVYVLMLEFSKLKDEQVSRIGFRDNMIHVHLTLVGATLGFGLTQKNMDMVLIVPWICFILGWTYLANDEKISAIARYIREKLGPRIRALISSPGGSVFRWEWFHREVERRYSRKIRWELAHRMVEGRYSRKIWQFIVDLTAFVLSGFAAIVVYVLYHLFRTGSERSGWPIALIALLIVIQSAMLIALGIQFYAHADFEVLDEASTMQDSPSESAQ